MAKKWLKNSKKMSKKCQKNAEIIRKKYYKTILRKQAKYGSKSYKRK